MWNKLMSKNLGGPGLLALVLAIVIAPVVVFAIGDTQGNSGSGYTQGWANSGAAWTGNPVQMGGVGSDGKVYALQTDLSATAITGSDTATSASGKAGRLMVVGPAATGAAVTGAPLYVGGSDGTNV